MSPRGLAPIKHCLTLGSDFCKASEMHTDNKSINIFCTDKVMFQNLFCIADLLCDSFIILDGSDILWKPQLVGFA